MTLYAELVATGLPIDHHESDLYVLATPESRAIVKRHNRAGVGSFVSQLDGRVWLDIPFAYAPFWDAVNK